MLVLWNTGLATSFPDQPQALIPLPRLAVEDPERVALGRRLFFDTRLSGDGRFSCATCHHLDKAYTDGRPRSISRVPETAAEQFNTPTLLNVSFNYAFGWRAEHPTLEAQVKATVVRRDHMGADWDDVLQRLGEDSNLVAAFVAQFADGLTADNVAGTIAAFERTLVTPDAPVDRYLRGEEDALSEEALCGFRLFNRYGCVSCHQGVNVGGNLLARFGVFRSPYEGRKDLVPTDLGRYSLTGLDEDRRVFRVPSLRNVALTAPYFHDGSAATLDEAVRVVARYQLGREVAGEQLQCLVTFLHALNGVLPEVAP